MDTGRNMMDSMFEKLDKYLRTETVVGEPMQVAEITVIPIITVSFGVGGGEGEGNDKEGNDGKGAGGGLGCRISPTAMLIIKEGEVSAIPLGVKGSLERIMEMVPGIISNINTDKKSSGKE